MEFTDVLNARYSVRKYKSARVEQEKIHAVLKAAQTAPTAANKQPQRILAVEDSNQLQKLDACTNSRYGAPLAFIVSYDSHAAWTRAYDGACSAETDASIVTAYMMLEAVNQGLGTLWVMHFDPLKLRQKFSIPENFIPAAILTAGYAADDAEPRPAHYDRLSLEEIVRYNHY